jgi:ribosomal-protein-alanine N-acetyltransferase
MTPLPTLSWPPILLRAARPSDAADRQLSGRSAELTRMCGGSSGGPSQMTEKEAIAWSQRAAAEPYGWVIDLDDRAIGTVRLHSLNAPDRRARLAIGIFAPECWGLGYGTLAIRLVLRYAFEELGLHRVDLRVLAYNTRAIACYVKCGFVREGVERESALVDGQWHSDVIMGILEGEFRDRAAAWFPGSLAD